MVYMDIWGEPVDGETVESRLWNAWNTWTAKSEAEATLSGVNVKAYNDSTNPFYDSLTRLMQLRIPIPGRKFQDGTISVCRLVYLKMEQVEERKKIGREGWYLKQKESAVSWKDHIHASVDLPPDKFVEGGYQSSFPHKYPSGIDSSYNLKQKKLSNIFSALQGTVGVQYEGMTDSERRGDEVDREMQRMNLEGVGEKERRVRLRQMGVAGDGKANTVEEIRKKMDNVGKKRMSTRERQSVYGKANVGRPDFGSRRKSSVMRRGGLGRLEEDWGGGEEGVNVRYSTKKEKRDVKARRKGVLG